MTTPSKYRNNLKAFSYDYKFSQRKDRVEVSKLMQIWVDHKKQWRKNPISEIDIQDHHFSIHSEHDHQYLVISCGKFTWVEDYIPVYITARFGS